MATGRYHELFYFFAKDIYKKYESTDVVGASMDVAFCTSDVSIFVYKSKN